MRDPQGGLHHLDRQVELLVSDVALARAWFEGVPAARLLARALLDRNEHDEGSFETFLARLLGVSSPARDRLARALARASRAAQDEGPLAAPDAVLALLVLAVSVSPDASLGETFASARTDALARACAIYEPRIVLGGEAARTAAFEACLRLATKRIAGPWPQGRVFRAARALAASGFGPFLGSDNETRLYPFDVDAAHARVALVMRAPLEAIARRDPRDLAKAVSALEREDGTIAGLDTLLADVLKLLEPGGEILLTAPPINPDLDGPVPSVKPSDGPVSSMPLDWSHPDAAADVATAYESALVPFPRLRQLVARGGEPALDAIGAEMLKVPIHPTASAAFAEVLAKSGRPRDVIRLVTYFAVTPDPLLAARALGECDAPELPSVLRAWLEAMLPPPGEDVPPGDDPDTSSAARIAACVSSLEPYPHLYGAVRPLLSRVSVAPPPPSG